jgi:hypothetical protein
MDEVHKWTFSTKHIGGGAQSPATKSTLAKYRTKLRQAEKFVIDDDTVKLVCHLSHDQKQLEGYSVLARLPYPTMWIEFNLHVKCQTYRDLGRLSEDFNPDEVSPIIGFLIYQDNHPTRWIAHSFVQVGGLLSKVTSSPVVIPVMLTYIFDPDGQKHSTPQGSDFWRAPTLSHLPGGLKIPTAQSKSHPDLHMVDPEYVIAGDLEFDHETQEFVAAPWFINRGAVIVDPFWNSWRGINLSKKILASEIIENAGAIRWLVTFLGALNALPKDLRQAQTQTKKRQVGAHILPYFQHRTITINLPRDDRIVWANKHLQSSLKNMPRPWHQVLGHWRIIERGKKQHLCRHMPTMIEDDIAMCQKCQLMIRWIKSHNRGDPAVGIVTHTYKTKAPKQKTPSPFKPNFELLDP